MKRVILILVAVVVCSLSAWCQVASVVSLGTEALEKNNFSAVKQMFNNEGFKIDEYAPANSSTYAVGMDGRGDASLLWAITANPNQTIKKVSFICGLLHWYGIEQVLQDAGYTLINSGTATLGNGATVPQKTFSKGDKRCYVQTLDNCMAQVIFKRQAVKTKRKK